MVESQSLGKHSSSSAVSAETALLRLKVLAQSRTVQKIYSALGPASKLAIVGGSVREAFLKKKKVDLDLATVFPPEKVKELLEKNKIHTYETGLRHGTITAVISKKNIEITTFRKAAAKQNNSYSETLEEDLSARDFTINALAYDLTAGKIIDPHNGAKDIQDRILRAVGKAEERFTEDPLRILRMVRFGPAAGRKLEDKTLAAARNTASLLETVSIERIRLELERILLSDFAEEGLRFLANNDLLKYVLPEILPTLNFEQNKFHVEDVFEHTLTVIKNSPNDLILRLAALFHDIGKPDSLSVDEDGNRHFYLHEEIGAKICKKAMRRLKFSNRQIEQVSRLVRMHMRPLDCGPAGVRRLMRDLGEQFEDWKELKKADMPPVMEKKEFEALYQSFIGLVESEKTRLEKAHQKILAINGDDLIELGEKPGKRLGNILSSLENLVIENPDLNRKDILIQKARALISDNQDIMPQIKETDQQPDENLYREPANGSLKNHFVIWFVPAIFFVFLLYIVNFETIPGKSREQVKYESWLSETESKTILNENLEVLPNISLVIKDAKDFSPNLVETIGPHNISNGKEKIMRLLHLISEAGLYRFLTDSPSAKGGHIVLRIESPDKSFTLNFKPSDVEKNIKASLMLKLFSEYSKDKIPENLAQSKKSEEMAYVKENWSELFENP